MINTLYTVRRIKSHVKEDFGLTDVDLSKISHGSDNGETTICGVELTPAWYIWTNSYDGKINCKACKNILKNRENNTKE